MSFLSNSLYLSKRQFNPNKSSIHKSPNKKSKKRSKSNSKSEFISCLPDIMHNYCIPYSGTHSNSPQISKQSNILNQNQTNETYQRSNNFNFSSKTIDILQWPSHSNDKTLDRSFSCLSIQDQKSNTKLNTEQWMIENKPQIKKAGLYTEEEHKKRSRKRKKKKKKSKSKKNKKRRINGKRNKSSLALLPDPIHPSQSMTLLDYQQLLIKNNNRHSKERKKLKNFPPDIIKFLEESQKIEVIDMAKDMQSSGRCSSNTQIIDLVSDCSIVGDITPDIILTDVSLMTQDAKNEATEACKQGLTFHPHYNHRRFKHYEKKRFRKQLDDQRVQDFIRIDSNIKQRKITLKKEKQKRAKFQPLSIEQTLIIKNNKQTVCHSSGSEVNTSDMQTLNSRRWLNDEIINFYIFLLQDRNTRQMSSSKVLFMNTFFYAKLYVDKEYESEYRYKNVQRWTRVGKLRKRGCFGIGSIFECHKMIFPVHVGNVHWCCGCINFKDKRIEYYDSMAGDASMFMVNMRRYLKDEYENKDIANSYVLNLDEWSDYECGRDGPQQMNSYDCGVFACKTADWLADDMIPDFSQRNMKYFRMRMKYEIISGRTID